MNEKNFEKYNNKYQISNEDNILNENSILSLDDNLNFNENYIWSKDHIDVEEIIEEDFNTKNKDYILYKFFIFIDSYIKLRELHDYSLKILISYINSYNILRIKYLELKNRITKIEIEMEEKNKEILKCYNVINNVNEEVINNIKANELNMIKLKSNNIFKVMKHFNSNIDSINYYNNNNRYTCKNFCTHNNNIFKNDELESKNNDIIYSKNNIEKKNLFERINFLTANLKEKDELLEFLNVDLSKKNLLLKQKENDLNKLKVINKSISFKNLIKGNKNKNEFNYSVNNNLSIRKILKSIYIRKYRNKISYNRNALFKKIARWKCIILNKKKYYLKNELKIENFNFQYYKAIKSYKFSNKKIFLDPLLRESNNTLFQNDKSGNCLDYFLKDLSFNDNNTKEIEVKLTKNYFKIACNYEINSENFFILSPQIQLKEKINNSHKIISNEHFKEAKSIYNKFFKKNKM